MTDTSQNSKKRGSSEVEGESIVVDFVASFVAGGEGTFEPVQGRVLMSEKRLVLATSEANTVIPLSGIYDVAVGKVPPEVEEFFDHTVMVGYVVGNERRTTVIGGTADLIEKFSLLLFRATLNGSATWLKHPAQVGGRVMETDPERVGLHLDSDAVVFPGASAPAAADREHFAISLGSVIFFEVLKRTVEGEQRLILSVRHVDGGQTVTTEISLRSRRKMNILGRYIRQMYHSIKTAVRDVDLDEEALEALVSIYSAAGMDVDLGELLDVDEETLTDRLEQLYEDDLITAESPPCSLTPQGQFVVNEEIEDVNL